MFNKWVREERIDECLIRRGKLGNREGVNVVFRGSWKKLV